MTDNPEDNVSHLRPVAAQAAAGAVPEGALEAAEVAVAPEPEPESPPVPATIPTAPALMPSANVVHAQLLHNEMRTKVANYEQGLMLLMNERDNIEARYQSDLADVQRRIDDHELCRAMATSSVDTFENAQRQ